jgi:hypothetical protein
MQYLPVLPELREILPVLEQHVMSAVIQFTALCTARQHEPAQSNHITRNHGAEN